MKVTLRVTSAAANALRRGEPLPAAERVLDAAKRHQGVLRPQHADVEGTRLAQYFVADVPDSAGYALLEDLEALPEVEAAYVKPAVAPAR